MKFSEDDFVVIKEFSGNKLSRIALVEHLETKKKVILKRVELVHPEKQKLEVQIHSKLDHKFIIKLIDYKFSEKYISMLIEFAKHGDLFGLLPKLKKSDEKTILKIFYGVVQAVNYLHQLGYVHRDIKPENILITKGMLPKLADFGTSAFYKKIRNTFCGTFEYMAPEIYLRNSQSSKVDIWALGILLYELFHGSTPFKRDTISVIRLKINQQSINMREDISVSIRDLILKIIKFSPEERPTCLEILACDIFDSFRDRTSCHEDIDVTSISKSLQELTEALKKSYKKPSFPVLAQPVTVSELSAFPDLKKHIPSSFVHLTPGKLIKQKAGTKDNKSLAFSQLHNGVASVRKNYHTPLQSSKSTTTKTLIKPKSCLETPLTTKLYTTPFKKKDYNADPEYTEKINSLSKTRSKQITIYTKNLMSSSNRFDSPSKNLPKQALFNVENKSAVKLKPINAVETTPKVNRCCSIEKAEYYTPQTTKTCKQMQLKKELPARRALKFQSLKDYLPRLEEKVPF